MSSRIKNYSHDFYTVVKSLNLYENVEYNGKDVFVCIECKQYAGEIIDINHGQDCAIEKLDNLIEEYETYLAFNSITTY